MSVDVKVSAVINRPLDEVAGFAADPSHAPDWYRRIQSVVWKTDPPVRRGSQMEFRAAFLGRKLVYTYEVTELDLPHQLTMSTAEGPFPMTTTYTWEPLEGDRTRMTLRNHGEPSGFSKLVAPLMAGAMRRAMRGDLRRLAQLLEAR